MREPASVPPCVLCHAPAPEALTISMTISLGGQHTRLWLCPQHRALMEQSFARWLQEWIAHNGGDEARGDEAMRGETVDAPAGKARRPRGRISYGWFATCACCEAVYDAGGAASVGVVAVHLVEAGWTQRDQATGARRDQAAEGTWICPVCAHGGDEACGVRRRAAFGDDADEQHPARHTPHAARRTEESGDEGAQEMMACRDAGGEGGEDDH